MYVKKKYMWLDIFLLSFSKMKLLILLFIVSYSFRFNVFLVKKNFLGF